MTLAMATATVAEIRWDIIIYGEDEERKGWRGGEGVREKEGGGCTYVVHYIVAVSSRTCH